MRRPMRRLGYDLIHVLHRDAFASLRRVAVEAEVSSLATTAAFSLLARIVAHTGKTLGEITTPDILALLDACRGVGHNTKGSYTAHFLLRRAGLLDDEPLTGGTRRRVRRLSVEELVDRYTLRSQEVRAVLIEYLREQAPAIDYATLCHTVRMLVKNFWQDIERHHPEVDSLRFPPAVGEAWKAQLFPPDGRVPNRAYATLISVRAFYLDLAHWAVQEPERWGAHSYVCPVKPADLKRSGKYKAQQEARVHDRLRTLMPLLEPVMQAIRHHRHFTAELLTAARAATPGVPFEVQGRAFTRLPPPPQPRSRADDFLASFVQPVGGPPLPGPVEDLEDDAFWTWAIAEGLRWTGLRIEELMELSQTSLKSHAVPGGPTVLLLQVAPSKGDRERLVPVCPELAHVLARVVERIRDARGRVPVVARYDGHERRTVDRLPFLFQRLRRGLGAVISMAAARQMFVRTCLRIDLRAPDGTPLVLTPHDFRRVFATEAVGLGLPIHVAAKVLGHANIETTRGYVGVFEDEVTRQYQAFLSRRRGLRPPEEYREPSEGEVAEFEAHFRKRKLALGDCYRPYQTPCPHEHACVRCPMLRMDPAQLPRLLQIEGDTHRLLTEARERGWEGEVQGLEATLQGVLEKRGQVERIGPS